MKAPMVGTFYRSANPEAKPYAEIGQTVEVGQVVCIIEAMKLMNEIKSEVKGKVVEILVENARSIEYGQVLFMVEPI
ncbi:MAG: acetyl-CoA carboxylase biotin carboxyl carrier protein [Candidatus Omnitrophota bacterium]